MTATEKPSISIPNDVPPTELLIEDLEVGSGEEAVAGSTVSVNYVGVAWSTRAEFDSSWEREEPFNFTLGKGRVIRGWDQGVIGMRVGGRRRLTIPPELGYGSAGSSLFIRPNETLVFVVDLTAVGAGSRAARGQSGFRHLFGRR
jgi:peptidylprolyl isomerase